MKENSSPKLSQLSRELSSIDVQKILLDRAKDAVLSTAVALLEQDMERLCGAPFSRKSSAVSIAMQVENVTYWGADWVNDRVADLQGAVAQHSSLNRIG